MRESCLNVYITVCLPCCQIWKVLSDVHPELSIDTQTLMVMAKCLRTAFYLPVLTCGKVNLVQANTIPEWHEYNLLESGKAESKVGTFNCQDQITLALWEDGEEQQLLTIRGSRCSCWPGEGPGCMMHWEAKPCLAQGDGSVLLSFVLHLPFFSWQKL